MKHFLLCYKNCQSVTFGIKNPIQIQYGIRLSVRYVVGTHIFTSLFLLNSPCIYLLIRCASVTLLRMSKGRCFFLLNLPFGNSMFENFASFFYWNRAINCNFLHLRWKFVTHFHKNTIGWVICISGQSILYIIHKL